MIRRLLALLLLMPAMACEPTTSCEAASMIEPVLHIGIGEKELELVVEGDWLPLDWGRQGGQHIWIGVRAEGVSPGSRGPFADRHDVPLELSPLLITIIDDGMRRYGADEWSPNIIRRLEEATGVNVRAPGFPSELIDDEAEEPGHEVIPRSGR